jgi:hypothetical protein
VRMHGLPRTVTDLIEDFRRDASPVGVG